MAEPLRLVFMGSDPVALPLLDWLAGEGHGLASLVGLVTGPDRPSGRGQATRPNPVRAWAEGRGFPVLQPVKLDAATLAALKDFRPDASLVVAYGQILKDDVIAVPRLGTLNLHASLLPKYRGASPIQTAVACGERETAVSLMRIVRELDAGPVAGWERVSIALLDTAHEVETKLSRAALPLLARCLPLLRDGTLPFKAQDSAQASFCRRLEKSDGVLDFAAPASVLAARVNGLHPWPSVAVEMAGTSVKLGQADWMEGAGGQPGRVVGAGPAGLLVATGAGLLQLRRLQRPGGRMLEGPEFLRGFSVPVGTLIPSRPMPPLAGPAPFRR